MIEDNFNAPQRRFLDSVSPYVALIGGVGSGKSTALQAKAMILKGINGDVPGLIMAETLGELFANVIDPMIEALEGALPAKLTPIIHTDNKGRREMRWADGCRVYLRSADSMKSFAGLNAGWLCADEPWLWRHLAYMKANERVRIPCPMLQRAYTSTPAMNFLADEFNTGRKYRETISASTYDNAHNLAVGYIDQIKESYSPRMLRAMIYGEWTVLQGAVYEAFDGREESTWLRYYDPADHLHQRTFLALDPGQRRSAWFWAHEINPTEWMVFDELIADDMSDEACVKTVNDRGWPIDAIVCDPAADQVQSAMSFDTIDMLNAVNMRHSREAEIFYVRPPFTRIAYGVDKTRVLIGDPDKNRKVHLYFAKRLLEIEDGEERGILKDLARYRYPEVKDDKPITDIPLKDGVSDHFADAARNLAVYLWLTSPLLETDKWTQRKLAKLKHSGFKQAAQPEERK